MAMSWGKYWAHKRRIERLNTERKTEERRMAQKIREENEYMRKYVYGDTVVEGCNSGSK